MLTLNTNRRQKLQWNVFFTSLISKEIFRSCLSISTISNEENLNFQGDDVDDIIMVLKKKSKRHDNVNKESCKSMNALNLFTYYS